MFFDSMPTNMGEKGSAERLFFDIELWRKS